MHIVLEVSETAPSREAAANKVTARVNAVLARARAKSSLKAESGRRYAEANRDDKNRIRNWTDSATIFVESRDFAALSKFAADSQKEASVQNLYFSVSPEKRAKAVEEAGDIALKSFAQRAQALSRSLGFSGYKIVRLNLRHSFNTVEATDAGMRSRHELESQSGRRYAGAKRRRRSQPNRFGYGADAVSPPLAVFRLPCCETIKQPRQPENAKSSLKNRNRLFRLLGLFFYFAFLHTKSVIFFTCAGSLLSSA